MTKIDIQYQDQFGKWRHMQTKHNDAYRSAAHRARSTGTSSTGGSRRNSAGLD